MCGLFTIIHKKELNIDNQDFLENLNYLNNRGPDHTGYFFQEKNKFIYKFGHKRLSILDLSKNGNQPMHIQNKSTLVYNGEIYNHNELRNIINKKNKINWKGTSDTETLLNLLDKFETKLVLNKINGMFAFVYCNYISNEIIIARDTAGEKPLYLYFDENLISFSSDLKPITKIKTFQKNINNSAFADYKKYSYIPYPKSIYNNVFKLPPASIIKINLNKFKFSRFANFYDLISSNGITHEEWWNIEDNIPNTYAKKNVSYSQSHNVNQILTSAVQKQLISDVPIGAFLSGGIDSSLIVSIASKLKSKLNTFTIGFDFQSHDESIFAEKIAQYLGTNHETYLCNKTNTIDCIDKLHDVFSEPFADSSQIPTLLISNMASKKVKVSLSGDGGDELFGGYNRYLYANKYWYILSKFPKNLRLVLISILENIPDKYKNSLLNFFIKTANSSSVKTSNFLEKIKFIENKYLFYDSLVSVWNNIDTSDTNNYKKYFLNFDNKKIEDLMMISDFKSYLPDDILCKVDRATMYHSLESRAPFLDIEVINYAFKLSLKNKIHKKTSKYILKEILRKYIPENLFNRPKMGFAIPLQSWLKNELKDYMMDTLSKNNIYNSNLFDYNLILKTINNHLSGMEDNSNKLWNSIQFINWYDKNN